MKSILYLLVNEDKSSFKIGITDNLEARHARLSSVWGKFDLASSCTLSGSRRNIAGLEKTLHYLLDKWRIQHSCRDEGHSEWFSIECFNKALELISSAASIRGNESESSIITGVVLPERKNITRKEVDSDDSIDLDELEQYWPHYEKVTLDFKDDPYSDGTWLWTLDISDCQRSPFDVLLFQTRNHGIALATKISWCVDDPSTVEVTLEKRSLSLMEESENFRDAYQFISSRIPRLVSIAQAYTQREP